MRIAVLVAIALLLCLALLIQSMPESRTVSGPVSIHKTPPPVDAATDERPVVAPTLVQSIQQAMREARRECEPDEADELQELEENDGRSRRERAALEARARLREEQRREARHRFRMRSIIRQLDLSADAEHLYVASVLTPVEAPDSIISRIERAARIDPASPLIAMQWLYGCSTFAEACEEGLGVAETFAITTDRSNAELWFTIANARATRNDLDGALEALRRANAATEYREYWFERILVFDRALAASTSTASLERLTNAIGMVAAMPDVTAALMKLCKSRGEESAEWRVECLRAGEKIESGAETIMSTTMGMALQGDVYELEGDTRRAAEVTQRGRRLRDRHVKLGTSPEVLNALKNETLMRRWIETAMAHGELAATEQLKIEAEALKDQPDYDPCLTLGGLGRL